MVGYSLSRAFPTRLKLDERIKGDPNQGNSSERWRVIMGTSIHIQVCYRSATISGIVDGGGVTTLKNNGRSLFLPRAANACDGLNDVCEAARASIKALIHSNQKSVAPEPAGRGRTNAAARRSPQAPRIAACYS
jgi:hypothetical protein